MRKKVWITFVLIVVLVALASIVVYPTAPDLTIGSYHKELKVHLGLDLQGGTRLVYSADTAAIPAGNREDALQGVRDVIERRVNAFGVSEPVVQTNKVGDNWRVSVELAGVKDINEAIKRIGETPLLEFQEEDTTPPEPVRSDEEAKIRAEDIINRAKKPDADFTALAKEYSDEPNVSESGGDLGFATRGQFVPEFEKSLFDDLKDGDISATPVKTQFGYHIVKRVESRETPNDDSQVTPEVHGQHILVITERIRSLGYKKTDLSGKNLKSTAVEFDQNTGAPYVSLQFDSEGGKLFAEITKRNIGKKVIILLDGQVVTDPVVQTEITDGQAIISGDFTIDEAKILSRRLNAGALPVAITLVSQQTIGPSLGRDSIARSLFAGAVGIAAVMLFMVLYYRLPGLLAVLALAAYSIMVLAIFKLWPVTLTLAGVAGFILSIGMAVDANILIFERWREELRAGRPFQSAVDEGFRRAWLSIRDSNISSLITALILAWFGTSIIKGFAITLSIGILVSMFSAITITRTLIILTGGSWLDRHRSLIGPKITEDHVSNHPKA